MQRKYFILGVLMAITASISDCGRPHPVIKIMTINLRYGTAADGENHWDKRKRILFECLKQSTPGIIATQEGLPFQLEEIKSNLPGVEYFGMGRYFNVPVRKRPHEHLNGEHCAIFYDSSQFDLERSSTFWLSDTPNVPGSMTWGNDLPRIVTWGIFRHKASQLVFAVFNTHYHWDEPFVTNSTNLLIKKISAIASDLPMVLTGDFNTTPDSEIWKTLTSPEDSVTKRPRFVDVWKVLKKNDDAGKSYHEFDGVGKERIDWILVTPELKPQAAERIEFAIDDHYPSDHFPITATLTFSKKK